jgi:hypothetical protein
MHFGTAEYDSNTKVNGVCLAKLILQFTQVTAIWIHSHSTGDLHYTNFHVHHRNLNQVIM